MGCALTAGAVVPARQRAYSEIPTSGTPTGVSDVRVGANRYSLMPQPRRSSQRRFPNGICENVNVLEAGRYKSYSGSRVRYRVPGTMPVRAVSQASAAGLFESFEGCTGPEWLPAGWERRSNVWDGQETDLSTTWHVTGAVGAYMPTNGVSQAFIGYSDSPQDEWLVSPEFVPESGMRLYADVTLPLFSIYDAAYYDTQTNEFSKRRVTATVAVRVFHDGVWDEIWNARDLASRIPDRELYEDHAEPEKHTLRLLLDDYAGQPVKVAFVYYGSGGNSAAVDYIAVAAPNNMAVYHRPRGFFFEGMNQEYQADPDFAALVGPAYTDARWNVLYTRDVQSVVWEFDDPENLQEKITLTESNPVLNYPYCITYAPSLTAKSNGLSPLTYTYDIVNKAQGIVKYGGAGIDMNDSSIEYGCGVYNWRCGLQGPMYDYKDGAFLFGPSSNADFWEPGGIHLRSIASVYEKPTAPYWFDRFWILANDLDADPDAEFTLNLYRIDDGGKLESRPFASVSIKVSDVLKFSSGDGYLYSLVFPFDEIVVDHAMLVELTGYMDNPKVRTFSPLTQNAPLVDAESNGYIFYERNGSLALSPTASLLSNFYCPFIFTMNATYSFLRADHSEWTAPEQGGEHIFGIDSYYLTSSWEIDGDIPEWIHTFETVEDVDAEGYAHMGLKVGVTPLEGTGRQWKFRIRIPGASQEFAIVQGDCSGVDAVCVDSGSPLMYDLNGRRMDSVTGVQGIYIVREPDGKFHKIVIK